MCLSCQYLPPADELNLQLALSTTGISTNVCASVRQGVDLSGKLNPSPFLMANHGKID